MRSNLPNDDFEAEENRRGMNVWHHYNDFIDTTTATLDLTLGVAFVLMKYVFVIGAITLLSFWCGRTAASLLCEIAMAAPAKIYGFFVSIPGMVGAILHRFVRFFTHDIPFGVSVLLTYPLSTLLTIAFLHLFLRAVFTTSVNNPESDSTIRGSRIQGDFDDSADYSTGEERFQNRRILWLFPRRRWLTSREKKSDGSTSIDVSKTSPTD